MLSVKLLGLFMMNYVMAVFFDTDWKTEIFKRLDALSEKLGVAAGHLWGVLTRQGVAIGIEQLLIGLTWLGLWVAVLIVGSRMRNVYGKSGDNDEEGWQVAGWLVTGLGQFLLLGVGGYLWDGIIYILNPEYFALQKILELFGK